MPPVIVGKDLMGDLDVAFIPDLRVEASHERLVVFDSHGCSSSGISRLGLNRGRTVLRTLGRYARVRPFRYCTPTLSRIPSPCSASLHSPSAPWVAIRRLWNSTSGPNSGWSASSGGHRAANAEAYRPH